MSDPRQAAGQQAAHVDGVKPKRTCAYCGGNRDSTPRCKCKYRFNRMGELGMEVSNITEQTTWAEVRKTLEENFGHWLPDTPVAFKFSVTKLDLKAIAKAKAKREEKTNAK